MKLSKKEESLWNFFGILYFVGAMFVVFVPYWEGILFALLGCTIGSPVLSFYVGLNNKDISKPRMVSYILLGLGHMIVGGYLVCIVFQKIISNGWFTKIPD